MFSLLSEQNNGIGSGWYYIFCYGLPRYILINFDQVKINVLVKNQVLTRSYLLSDKFHLDLENFWCTNGSKGNKARNN